MNKNVFQAKKWHFLRAGQNLSGKNGLFCDFLLKFFIFGQNWGSKKR